ncbi:hypothetical protein GCM10022251_35350 [Phytohabitans flavus]|uniref:Uncharacterized protein n=1 Tax=Phytohabitans flavus TaxID=1076124 RepID=A0A6F8XMV5_9ACTN|nr:hypothetical protein [Phytohabitans flavus]BCB75101.1 hypothetical protein Pflav_015110 [Phytohabitans flavus]
MSAVPVLICVLALAAACSPTTDPGVPTANSSGSAAQSAGSGGLTAYAKCIRDHGVNVPEPAQGVDARAWIRQQADANPAFDAAAMACVHLAPADSGEHAQQVSAQELEQLRAYAVCMRAHQIDVSDPTPQGSMTVGGRLKDASKAQLEADPAYRAAHEACKDKLPTQGAK